MKGCQSNNPATCRYHGIPESKIDFEKGIFNIDFETTAANNLVESQRFEFFLNSEELETVKQYCDQDYTQINTYLHNADNTVPSEFKAKIKILDEALSKVPPLSEPRLVYRAGKPYVEGELEYKQFDTLEEADEFYRNHFDKGKIITFKGFTSTTEDPNCLVDFTSSGYDSHPPKQGLIREEYNRIIGREGTSNIIYEINTRKGVALSSFGQTYAKKEQEILLPRDTQYKVVAVHTNKILTFINRLPYEDRPVKRLVTVVQLEEV